MTKTPMHCARGGCGLLLTLLIAFSLSGCLRMGMRTYTPEQLQERYGFDNSLFMTVDGTKIHYQVDGNPDGPPMVLLHGVLASTHTWNGWVEELGDEYQIFRMDLPGFGLSEPLASADYTPEYAVEFFEMCREKLVEQYGAKAEKFHLVGNSLGGFIAWYYATKHPEHVEKLVLIDPIAYQQELPRIIDFASGGFGGTMAKISSPRFVVKRNVRKVYGNPETPSDEVIKRYHDLLLYDGHKEAMVEYFKTLRKYNEEDTMAKHVKEIHVPTLLMWGGKDRWVPPDLIDQWKRDVEGLEVQVYPEGGHIPMEEFPERTARDAAAFLAGGGVAAQVAESAGAAASTSEAGWDTSFDEAAAE